MYDADIIALEYIQSVVRKDYNGESPAYERKANHFLSMKLQAAAFDHFIQTTPVPKGEMLKVLMKEFKR